MLDSVRALQSCVDDAAHEYSRKAKSISNRDYMGDEVAFLKDMRELREIHKALVSYQESIQHVFKSAERF